MNVQVAVLRTEAFSETAMMLAEEPATGPILLRRAEVLFREGEPASRCFRVRRGLLRLCRMMSDGRRQVSAFVFAGEVVGCGDLDRHDTTAEAICETVLVPGPVWHDTDAIRDPQRLAQLVRRLARDLTAERQRTFVLSRMTAEERVANFLIEVAARIGIPAGGAIPVTMPRADIADYLGLTTETVCRVLSRLKAAGIIDLVARSRIQVNRSDALRELACAA